MDKCDKGSAHDSLGVQNGKDTLEDHRGGCRDGSLAEKERSAKEGKVRRDAVHDLQNEAIELSNVVE